MMGNMVRAAPTQAPQDEKLRELIVYIAWRSKKDPDFGAVKLNKLLYFVDAAAYRELGKSITGSEYQHLPEGPCPRRVLPAREHLLSQTPRAIQLAYQQTPIGNRLHRIIPKRKPYSIFSKAEREIVDRIVKHFESYTGTQLSDLSHREFGWRFSTDYQTIHLRTSWLSPEPLTEEQIQIGQRLARKYGLTL
jgi:uncharacterized phage-associated protein